MTAERARRACLAVLAFTAACLAGVDVFWRTPYWHDESWYLASVKALAAEGFSARFVRGLPGPAGPLFAVVHFAFSPLTALEPHAVRVVNLLMFGAFLAVFAVFLRKRGFRYPVYGALSMLAAPMVYAFAGTALTETPALVFFGLQLVLLVSSLEGPGAGVPRALAAGLCLGIAATGRQQYVAALGAVPVLWLGFPARRKELAAYALSAAAPPAALFAVWHGLVPPTTEFVSEGGISIYHGLLSFSYAGLVYSLFDPSWLKTSWRLSAAAFAVTTVANLAWGPDTVVPLLTVAQELLPPALLPFYSRAACGVLMGFGVVFLIHAGKMSLKEKTPLTRFLWASSFLLLLTPLKILHQFGGRYITPALPMLVALGQEHSKDTGWKALRLAAGCLLGLVSLYTYYYNCVRFAAPLY